MSRACLRVVVVLMGLALARGARAQRFHVEPYLQNASPTSMWVAWETTADARSVVSFGPTPALGREVWARTTRDGLQRRFHAAELAGLRPGTRYFYRVRTGKLSSDLHEFRTPYPPEAQKPVRIVALSDMQWDYLHPRAFQDLVERSILPLASLRGGPAQAFDMVLIAGDLVRDGERHHAWTREFFAPIRALAEHVPVYPVLGNHEENDALYFRYFTLPSNGPSGLLEHAYWVDRGNVRVIGLDSNTRYRNKEQLAWLDALLAQTCDATHVDFVVAAAHHPEHSELWPRGESDYTGLIASRLEQAASRCQKPAILITGHTHAYARGHSRDHALTLLTIGSAGGRIDHFGDYEQVDYPEYVVSQDDYGYVLLDATRGPTAALRITRVSRGDEETTRDRVRDSLVLKRHNLPPAQPRALSPRDEPVDPQHAILVSSPFVDGDGDGFGAVQFQLAGEDCNFALPVLDRWVQHRNEWQGRDLRIRADQSRLELPRLREGTQYCYRMRVRDRALAWSEWSVAQRFHTTKLGVAQRD